MPIATTAFVVSALIFAPLSSYVAGRRARSPVIWFVLGGLIGPLAVLLLLLAPPGRCPDCEARVRGWAEVCAECGSPLSGAIRARQPTVVPPSTEAPNMVSGSKPPPRSRLAPNTSPPARAARANSTCPRGAGSRPT